jgi:multiple sugar transport system substrate-binding protein
MKTISMRQLVVALGLTFGMTQAIAADTVNFWYHVDNPENTKIIQELVKSFEQKNPDITIKAENVPWNSYYDKLFTSIIGGKTPDVAMVKLAQQPQLVEMEALEPIDARIATWAGKADIDANLFEINKASDGKQYYLPLQYVVVYLYYRADLFAKAKLNPPATCEDFLNAAKTLTVPAAANGGVPQYGFGMRGGKGGHDNWGPFVLSQTAFTPEGLKTAKANEANAWYIDLFRKHKVTPNSAPNDGFNEILSSFKAGNTAMIFHHIGSAKSVVEALGDKVAAVPVPSCGGGRWTYFGDESTAMFKNSRAKNASWKWMSFLSEGENNAKFNLATGQMTVSKSAAKSTPHPERFVKVTAESLPFAKPLPSIPQMSDFVTSAWPVNVQRAMIGEVTPVQMMDNLSKHITDK